MRSVPLDYVSEGVVAFAKSLKTDVFKSRPLFFWYDYFCCPQMEHRISTCHATLRKESDLLRAIQSIPAYVKKSEFFFALCPVVESPSEGKVFTHRTWARQPQGWSGPLSLSQGVWDCPSHALVLPGTSGRCLRELRPWDFSLFCCR